MPHIILKLYPGRSEEQKKQFCDKVCDAAVEILKCSPTHLSMSIEEVDPKDWKEKVEIPDILNKPETLYRK